MASRWTAPLSSRSWRPTREAQVRAAAPPAARAAAAARVAATGPRPAVRQPPGLVPPGSGSTSRGCRQAARTRWSASSSTTTAPSWTRRCSWPTARQTTERASPWPSSGSAALSRRSGWWRTSTATSRRGSRAPSRSRTPARRARRAARRAAPGTPPTAARALPRRRRRCGRRSRRRGAKAGTPGRRRSAARDSARAIWRCAFPARSR
mmetsp:Transcript_57787/g.152012  ORF Transcript_57787/g.152012 Transcript_57787/m.152012 type:complete len:208 (-) Transcript_57787:400-1023(-)